MPKKNKGTERGRRAAATTAKRKAWRAANPELAVQGFALCVGCDKGLPAEAFYIFKHGPYYPICRDCNRERTNEWRRQNSDRVVEVSRHKWLKKKYGLTVEDYDRMAAEQGGQCAICGGPPVGRGTKHDRFHVDHDHETGVVRALLCFRCNNGLGYFLESPEIMEAAARYIRKWKRKSA